MSSTPLSSTPRESAREDPEGKIGPRAERLDEGKGSTGGSGGTTTGATFIDPESATNLDQARQMIRMLTSQADEARADKTVMWEQTRADSRAMAQVAKNIEGNQGMLAKVVATLEGQLTLARSEKESAVEAARADKRMFERLTREVERQLKEAEKQRDKAQAEAVAANNARRQAQESLESARRADSEVLRSLQSEKNAMSRELRELREKVTTSAADRMAKEPDIPQTLARLASGMAALQTTLGSGDDAATRLLAAARSARDESEAKLDELRAAMGVQIRELMEQKEAALAELSAVRGGGGSEMNQMQTALEVSNAERDLLRQRVAELETALSDERASKEKMLVQARIDQSASASREREHAQQMGGKAAQVSALEREIAMLAGQLVSAQAEAAELSRRGEAAARERALLLQVQQSLEADKNTLQAQLRGAEQERAMHVEQLAQCAGDREFCVEVIRDLRAQLVAAQAATQEASVDPGVHGVPGSEVRI